MKIIDLNLLIYAINEDAPCHKKAKNWLEHALFDDEPVGIPWVAILGFLRITTNGRIMPSPLSPDVALEIVSDWLQQPFVRILSPSERHWDIFRQVVEPLGTAGNLTTDAHLAALALEYGGTLYSTDNDFSRFQFLNWVNPLADRSM
jgi:toxin-antitoxin system PIN domain toxin